MSGARGLPRPRRPAVPVLGTAAVLGAWAVVGHDSGVGWVQALGALVAGLLLVGLLGPGLAVARARCTVVGAPLDAIVGQPCTLDVSVSAALEVRPVEPPGPAEVSGPSARLRVEVRPERRGVAERCTVEIASAAPFGLLWWSRRVSLLLPRPIAVAPRTGTPDRSLRSVPALGDARPSARPGAGDDLRGARPYAHGDLRHQVHWRLSAHTGRLLVRETERPAASVVTVDGVLPDEVEAAEVTAERVMGTVGELLSAGAQVELVTAEPGGPVRAVVATIGDAGRRMARALPRAADPPE